jgi:hypothetical protein
MLTRLRRVSHSRGSKCSRTTPVLAAARPEAGVCEVRLKPALPQRREDRKNPLLSILRALRTLRYNVVHLQSWKGSYSSHPLTLTRGLERHAEVGGRALAVRPGRSSRMTSTNGTRNGPTCTSMVDCRSSVWFHATPGRRSRPAACPRTG